MESQVQILVEIWGMVAQCCYLSKDSPGKKLTHHNKS